MENNKVRTGWIIALVILLLALFGMLKILLFPFTLILGFAGWIVKIMLGLLGFLFAPIIVIILIIVIGFLIYKISKNKN